MAFSFCSYVCGGGVGGDGENEYGENEGGLSREGCLSFLMRWLRGVFSSEF